MSNLTIAAIALMFIPIMKKEYKRMVQEEENRKKRVRKYTQTEFI